MAKMVLGQRASNDERGSCSKASDYAVAYATWHPHVACVDLEHQLCTDMNATRTQDAILHISGRAVSN